MPKAPVEHRPGQSTVAYRAIKERILDVEFSPGVALSEYKLAAMLEMSRTPVREALKQLELEGLVRSVPRKGVFVTQLSVQDIHEIYQIRDALEVAAVRIAAERMPQDRIERLIAAVRDARKGFEKGNNRAWLNVDREIHGIVIATTQNGRLATVLGTFEDQVRRLFFLTMQDRTRVEASLAELSVIVDAIAARDRDRAAVAMQRHLRQSLDNAIRLAVPSMAFEVTGPSDGPAGGRALVRRRSS